MAKCVYDGKGDKPDCENCIDTVGAGMVCTHDCVIELREEIAALCKRIAVYEEVVDENGGRFLKQEAEIAKRDALIKELAGQLNTVVESDDGICDCYYFDKKGRTECANKSTVCFPRIRALVQKAREVVK